MLSERIRATEKSGIFPYQKKMILSIGFVEKSDFGEYKCVAKNPSALTESTIVLKGEKCNLQKNCIVLPTNYFFFTLFQSYGSRSKHSLCQLN